MSDQIRLNFSKTSPKRSNINRYIGKEVKIKSFIKKFQKQSNKKASLLPNRALLLQGLYQSHKSIFSTLFLFHFPNGQTTFILNLKLEFHRLISNNIIVLLVQPRNTKHGGVAHDNPQLVI